MIASPNSPKLSAHAKKLLKRLHKEHYYYIRAKNPPRAMQKLIEAGLVERGTKAPRSRRLLCPEGNHPDGPGGHNTYTGTGLKRARHETNRAHRSALRRQNQHH